MRPDQRTTARRQIDKRLAAWRKLGPRPQKGWITAIRQALGMTQSQLAARLRVSHPAVISLEKNEARGAITLASLERAARALDCELVYALVPRRSLEAAAEERAEEVARRRLRSTAHSMALEDQAVGADETYEHIKRIAKRLLEQPRSSGLWDD
jgi:predicted DNA-binding mobile mystery protein A